ncbi:hypothetical protein D3C84_815620 [compost metagenome]
MNINNIAPSAMQKQENSKLPPGTFLRVIDPKTEGACLTDAKPNSVLLVQKMPLFAADIADVVTTRFIMPAAIGNPEIKNNCTKGLLSAEIAYHDETLIMQISDKT